MMDCGTTRWLVAVGNLDGNGFWGGLVAVLFTAAQHLQKHSTAEKRSTHFHGSGFITSYNNNLRMSPAMFPVESPILGL